MAEQKNTDECSRGDCTRQAVCLGADGSPRCNWHCMHSSDAANDSCSLHAQLQALQAVLLSVKRYHTAPEK